MGTILKKNYKYAALIIFALLPLKVASAGEILSLPQGLEKATFAAGCFWCVEADFDKLDGVVKTISGYTGGHTLNPTYDSVGTQQTGHVEAVLIYFDPNRITYEKLLDYYWHHVDFLDGEGQFCDRGSSYRPIIFTHTNDQDKAARKSKDALAHGRPLDTKISVKIEPAALFTPAEEYHQDYYKKNPIRYHYYRLRCGRDKRIQNLWHNDASE